MFKIRKHSQVSHNKRTDHFTVSLPAIKKSKEKEEQQGKAQKSIPVLDSRPHNWADGRSVTLEQGDLSIIWTLISSPHAVFVALSVAHQMSFKFPSFLLIWYGLGFLYFMSYNFIFSLINDIAPNQGCFIYTETFQHLKKKKKWYVQAQRRHIPRKGLKERTPESLVRLISEGLSLYKASP